VNVFEIFANLNVFAVLRLLSPALFFSLPDPGCKKTPVEQFFQDS
jgi:hypothetical protein